MTDAVGYFDDLVERAKAGDADARQQLQAAAEREDINDVKAGLRAAEMRERQARSLADLRLLERNWWRRVSLIFLAILLLVAALLRPAMAGEPAPAGADIIANCWRFDAVGQRRLVWSATGSAYRWTVRNGQDVLQVQQSQRRWAHPDREVEHVVEPGEACVIGPRAPRDE